VLRAVDHVRAAAGLGDGVGDPRVGEAVEHVRGKRSPAGRWALERRFGGRVWFPEDDGVGRPSRWLTLRALRVLRWGDCPGPLGRQRGTAPAARLGGEVAGVAPRCENRVMAGPNFSRAFDLSTLRAAPAAARAAQPAAAGSGQYVVAVTEATFETDVLARSQTVPVVVDFWADWCTPCKTLSPALVRLSDEFAGRFVLATIDVDANQQLAAAAQVQSIPLVLGVIRGQAIPLFQGAVPEAQLRQYLTELLRVAAANGVSGVAAPLAAGGDEPDVVAEPPGDPRFESAYDAIEAGDYATAAAAYREVLRQAPGDPDAQAGLAQAELLQRTEGHDPARVRAAADAAPDDVAAACLAADVDVLDGDVERAFARLVDTVRRTAGADREAAREHLVTLFAVIGEDPRVLSARRALASALF
jgi:putative thioredoxin